LRAGAKGLELSVADNGPGIRAQDDSIAGEGATFHFYLPYEQTDVLTENAPG
jgi:signal transduction histidine kinase